MVHMLDEEGWCLLNHWEADNSPIVILPTRPQVGTGVGATHAAVAAATSTSGSSPTCQQEQQLLHQQMLLPPTHPETTSVSFPAC